MELVRSDDPLSGEKIQRLMVSLPIVCCHYVTKLVTHVMWCNCCIKKILVAFWNIALYDPVLLAFSWTTLY